MVARPLERSEPVHLRTWFGYAAASAASLWLAGIFWRLAVWFRDYMLLCSLRRSSRPTKDKGLQNAVAMAVEKLGPGVNSLRSRRLAISSVAIHESDRVAAPCALGVFRPAIIAPSGLGDALSETELLAVMLHECAHILRRDPATAIMQRLAGAIYWWNPLGHCLNRWLADQREIVCDDYAAAALGGGDWLAEAIVKVAEWRGEAERRPKLKLSLLNQNEILSKRIERLTDEDRTMVTRLSTRSLLFASPCFVLLGALLFTPALRAQRAADDRPNKKAADIVKQKKSPKSKRPITKQPAAEEAAEEDQEPSVDENVRFQKRKKSRAADIAKTKRPEEVPPLAGNTNVTCVYRLKYVEARTLEGLLNKLFDEALKRSGGRCVADAITNSIIARCHPTEQAMIETLLIHLDSPPGATRRHAPANKDAAADLPTAPPTNRAAYKKGWQPSVPNDGLPARSIASPGVSSSLAAQIELADKITLAAFAVQQTKSRTELAKKLGEKGYKSSGELRNTEVEYGYAKARYNLLMNVLVVTLESAKNDLDIVESAQQSALAKRQQGVGSSAEVNASKRGVVRAEAKVRILSRILQVGEQMVKPSKASEIE